MAQSFAEFMNGQMRETLQQAADDAVVAGDTTKAKAAFDKLAEFDRHTSGAPAPQSQQPAGGSGPAFTAADAIAEFSKLADWYGTDPKKTKAANDIANNLLHSKFKTAAEYAKAVKDAYDAEHGEPSGEEGDGEEGGEGEDDPPTRREPKPPAGGAPMGGGRRTEGGSARVPTKFSDIPRAEREPLERFYRRNARGSAEEKATLEKNMVKTWHEMKQKKAQQGARR